MAGLVAPYGEDACQKLVVGFNPQLCRHQDRECCVLLHSAACTSRSVRVVFPVPVPHCLPAVEEYTGRAWPCTQRRTDLHKKPLLSLSGAGRPAAQQEWQEPGTAGTQEACQAMQVAYTELKQV